MAEAMRQSLAAHEVEQHERRASEMRQLTGAAVQEEIKESNTGVQAANLDEAALDAEINKLDQELSREEENRKTNNIVDEDSRTVRLQDSAAAESAPAKDKDTQRAGTQIHSPLEESKVHVVGSGMTQH